MNTKLLPGTALLTFVLVSMATVGMAEVQPPDAVPTKLAREISIKQALRTVTPSQSLQTVMRQEYPAQEIFQSAPKNLERLPNGCEQKGASLCYDYRSGRAMYKPMRKLLPGLPGMTPHNLSIHRNRIVAQYSFK
jgi:hypothetical protein